MKYEKIISINNKYGQSISLVEITNTTKKTATISNEAGIATIVGEDEDIILISHISFEDEQFNFKNLPSKIDLFPSDDLLDEVVINSEKKSLFKPIAIAASVLFLWAKLRGKPKGLNAAANQPRKIIL